MDGAVTCPCVRKGHTRAHPFPKLLLEPLPGLLTLHESATEAQREAHEEWLATACPHSLMQLASECLWLPGEHGLLAAALGSIPAQDRMGIAALARLVEAATAPPATPPECVEELSDAIAWVQSHIHEVWVYQGVDEATGEVIVEGAPSRAYCHTGDGDVLGIDHSGLFVERRGVRVLQTTRLLQSEEDDAAFTLADAGGAARVKTSAAFEADDAENPDRRRPLPRTIVHRKAQRAGDQVAGLLEPLARLVEAARDTGHCIVWFDD